MDKKSRKRDRAVKDLSPRNTQDVKGGKGMYDWIR